MRVVSISAVAYDIHGYCPYKGKCNKPANNLISLGKPNEPYRESLAFAVCDEHLEAYLSSNSYVKVPILSAADLKFGLVDMQEFNKAFGMSPENRHA